jgi:hypothetical protein
MRRCVVEDDAAVRGNDRVGQERHRSVISGDDAVAWNVVTALSNPLGHAGDVDRGLLDADEEQCDVESQGSGSAHHVHLAGMRHHRFEAEAGEGDETDLPLLVGLRLRPMRALFRRTFEGSREVVPD